MASGATHLNQLFSEQTCPLAENLDFYFKPLNFFLHIIICDTVCLLIVRLFWLRNDIEDKDWNF